MSEETITRRRILREAPLLEEDWREIRKRRGDHNRLGFAYHLTFVRFYHRLPKMEPLEQVDPILRYTAAHLKLSEEHLFPYRSKRSTQLHHRREVLEYLGLRPFDDEQGKKLGQFLLEESFRIDQTSVLLEKAEHFLRAEKTLVPFPSTLQRLVSEQRVRARQELYGKISRSLSAANNRTLDGLLELEEGATTSRLQQIKANPAKSSPEGIKRLIEKIQTIEATGILTIDISWVHPNYQRALYNHVRKSYTDRLKKTEPNRRRALLVCFLHQRYRDGIDQIIDMFDKLMTRISTRSDNALKETMFKQRRVLRQSARFTQQVATCLLNEALSAEEKVEQILAQFSQEELAALALEADPWASGKKSHVFHLIVAKYGYLRKFAPVLLNALTFVESPDGSSSLKALHRLKELNASKKRTIEADVPTDFLSNTLRPMVLLEGVPDRHAWETALLLKCRDEIKAGNIYVKGSKRFGDFQDFLISEEEWAAKRVDFFEKAGLPCDAKDVPAYLTDRINTAYDRFLTHPPQEVTFDQKGWTLIADPAESKRPEDTASLEQLQRWLGQHMRHIRLPNLLIEVDNTLHFTRHFQPAADQGARFPQEVCAIMAALMAHGCNLGLHTTESLIEGVTYAQLKRISDWQITPEAQREALAAIADGIAALDITLHWGEGKTSASDGQRFAYPQKRLQQAYSTKFQDFALEFYSFIADNYAPFYSLPIECQERDGGYVLDGVLYNESDLDLEEHYTDTHGYTEINFAAFTMLGRRFCPRIKNHAAQRIYKIDPNREYGDFAALLKSTRTTLDPHAIARHWDEMGRFYASLEAGHTTASTALKRLVAYNEKNHFHRANRDFGRLIKTEFLLEYLAQPQLRQRIRQGLLKVEQLHQLARDIFFAKRGRISAREIHQQLNACSCLTLIAAAIIYWQAQEIARLLNDPPEDIATIDPSLVAHISPINWENVVLYGQYHLNPKLVKP